MKKGCCIGCRRHSISKWSGTTFSYWNKRRAPLTKAIKDGEKDLTKTRKKWLAGFAKDEETQKLVHTYNSVADGKQNSAATTAKTRQKDRIASQLADKSDRMKAKHIWVASDASIQTASVVGVQRDIADDVGAGKAILVNIPIASDFHFQTASIKIIGPKSNNVDETRKHDTSETFVETSSLSGLSVTTALSSFVEISAGEDVSAEAKMSEGRRAEETSKTATEAKEANEANEAKTRHQREHDTMADKFRRRARSTTSTFSASPSFLETLSGKRQISTQARAPSAFSKTLFGKGGPSAAEQRMAEQSEAEKKAKERANSVAFWSDLGPTLSRVGHKTAVDNNYGRVDMYLNGKKLTKEPVWHTHSKMYTYWEYQLGRDDLAHLHDGINDLKIVPYKSHATTITMLDVFINTQVKVTNGFLAGDGATFLATPFTLVEAEELKSDFTIEAWVRLPQKRTTFKERCTYQAGSDGNGDIVGQGATVAADAKVCQARCASVEACALFAYHKDDKSCKLFSNAQAEEKIEMATTVPLDTNHVCGPTSASGVIISRGPPSAPHFALYDTGDTGKGFHVRWANHTADEALTVVDNYNLPQGRWFHLAVAYDDVALIVYVDGYLVAEKHVGRHSMAGWDQGTEPLNIGALWDGGDEVTAVRRFVGQLDDVVVWGEGRSSQQILKDMIETQWGDKVDEILDSDLQNNMQDDTDALAATEARTEARQAARDAGIKDDELEGTDDSARNQYAEVLVQYGFEEEAGATEVRDWTGSDDKAAEVHGDVGVSEVTHAAEIRVWRNCPGAEALGQSAICGGINDVTGEAHGMCDTYDNSCRCNKNFFGVDCKQSCPTHHSLGVCSGNGDDTGPHKNGCQINLDAVIKDGWKEAGKSISANKHPDVTAPAYCTCKKADKASKSGMKPGKRFIGQYCEHECPLSAEMECSGHGTCTVKDVDENSESPKFEPKCACEPGYFGAGCQRVCAGMQSVVSMPTAAPIVERDGMCGGHGQCHYYGDSEHCNSAEWKCAGSVNKKCVCNNNGGWYEYQHAGGTCTLATPGATGGKDNAPASTRNNICYGRGYSNLPATPGETAFGKDQGAFLNVPSKDDLMGNGPTSICLFCKSGGQGRAVDNGGGKARFDSISFVGPDSSMATDKQTPEHANGEAWSAGTVGSKCNTNNPIARSTKDQRCGNVFSGSFRCEAHEGGEERNAQKSAGMNMARLLTKRYGFSTQCAGSTTIEKGKTEWDQPFRYDNGKHIVESLSGCGSAHHHVKSWKKCW